MLPPPMTKESADYWLQWLPASGHPGGWRVVRQFYPPFHNPPPGEPRFQEACGPKGRLRLFRSREAAQRAADKLNAKEGRR